MRGQSPEPRIWQLDLSSGLLENSRDPLTLLKPLYNYGTSEDELHPLKIECHPESQPRSWAWLELIPPAS